MYNYIKQHENNNKNQERERMLLCAASNYLTSTGRSIMCEAVFRLHAHLQLRFFVVVFVVVVVVVVFCCWLFFFFGGGGG